ncbi:MAG TPA: hypothetical protein VFG69_21350, partial [Nannocystaceae bacterium]|nr:hypothetical protein [Nannocystaceae bacterium]
MRSVRILAALALAIAACSEGGDDREVGETSGDDETASAASTTEGDGDTNETGAVDSSGSTGAPLVDVPATGIAVDFVEINQGDSVRIGEDGAGVGPTARTAPVIANRLALVRGFYTLADDWQPREIEARLVLQHADGTTETVTDSKPITESSFAGSLDRTFFWGVEAEKMQPGLEFRVELWEAEPGPEGGGTPPQLPADGSFAAVGIEDSSLLMRAVIVPIEYSDGMGCTTSPDISESTMQLYEDLMFMMNPLDRIEIEIRAPIQWNTPLASFSELNVELSDL